MSDEEIIQLFKCDEERAFRMLVKKYSEKLYWHIRKIVLDHEDCNDILQNSFMHIWQGLRKFRGDAQLYTWMYRIATNEAISFLHEKGRKVYGHSEEITQLLEEQLENLKIGEMASQFCFQLFMEFGYFSVHFSVTFSPSATQNRFLTRNTAYPPFLDYF